MDVVKPPFQMKLTHLEEVPMKSGGLPMFKLTGKVDGQLVAFRLPNATGNELRENLRGLYGRAQLFSPPASVELHGRWRNDTGVVFDATRIKVDKGRVDERAPELKVPGAKTPERAL